MGVNFNPKQYKGDIGDSYFKFNQSNLNPGLTLNRYVNNLIDANLNFNAGRYGYANDSNQSFRF